MKQTSEIKRLKADIKKLKEWLKSPKNCYFQSSIRLQLKFQKKLLKQLKSN